MIEKRKIMQAARTRRFGPAADEFFIARRLAATRFFVRKVRRLEALKITAPQQWKIFCIEQSNTARKPSRTA
ncbi:hypothetical protein [Pseudomonas fluorescens]|uniref:hypothetical protein n=1 Tax=Pseudomonas fluorescens TaxID=294 RepID=UPI001241BCBD|nr:hypothetical protein [Pseudomonas fluorescens]